MSIRVTQRTLDIGLDSHIRDADAEFIEGQGWFFPHGGHVTARFNINEGEPEPPDHFQVEWVTFGGDHNLVHYTIVAGRVRIYPECFFPNTREIRAFEAYRQSLIEFLEYRNKLLRKS